MVDHSGCNRNRYFQLKGSALSYKLIMFWLVENSLCWKHISGCFISRIFSASCFVLQLPCAFSRTLSYVQALTQTHFIPSSDPTCSWCAIPLLCWVKIQSFSASAQSLSHKTCTCCSYLFCKTFFVFTFLCLFFSPEPTL